METTHEVLWTNSEGYKFRVKTDFMTANELHEALKAAPKKVREVITKSLPIRVRRSRQFTKRYGA